MIENRKKILYVIESLNVGGAERQVCLLANNLPRDKYEVYVCVFSEQNMLIDYNGDNKFTLIKMKRSSKIDLRLIIGLADYIAKEEIALVHSLLYTANYMTRLACMLLKKKPKIVTSELSAGFSCGFFKNIFTWFVDYLLSFMSDKVMVNGLAVKRFVVAKGIPADKIEVIYNALTPLTIKTGDLRPEEIREALGVPHNKYIICMVARLDKAKDHRTLLRAIQLINNKNVVLLLVGDGEERGKIVQWVKDCNLEENVKLLGWVKDVEQYIYASDVCVLSSLREGFSNALIEYMSAAKPIVATNVGGNSEMIINGETGILVPPKNPQGLAAAIDSFIKNPSLAIAMGKKAKKAIKDKFSLEQMVKDHDQLYARLLHK